mmetsp:Transcript_29788/g.94961  ORF Transcript_29788/g.94961 Transcript_29788/m.94961 type:complete len:224 (+) Transcript_29788:380-1051(+)
MTSSSTSIHAAGGRDCTPLVENRCTLAEAALPSVSEQLPRRSSTMASAPQDSGRQEHAFRAACNVVDLLWSSLPWLSQLSMAPADGSDTPGFRRWCTLDPGCDACMSTGSVQRRPVSAAGAPSTTSACSWPDAVRNSGRNKPGAASAPKPALDACVSCGKALLIFSDVPDAELARVHVDSGIAACQGPPPAHSEPPPLHALLCAEPHVPILSTALAPCLALLV